MSSGSEEYQLLLGRIQRRLEERIQTATMELDERKRSPQGAGGAPQSLTYLNNAVRMVQQGALVPLIDSADELRGIGICPHQISNRSGQISEESAKRSVPVLMEVIAQELPGDEANQASIEHLGLPLPPREATYLRFILRPKQRKALLPPTRKPASRTAFDLSAAGINDLPFLQDFLQNMGARYFSEAWPEESIREMLRQERQRFDVVDITIPNACRLTEMIAEWMAADSQRTARLVLVDPQSEAMGQRSTEIATVYGDGGLGEAFLVDRWVHETVETLDRTCQEYLSGPAPRIEVRLVPFRPPYPLYMTSRQMFHGFFLKGVPSRLGVHIGSIAGGAVYDGARMYFESLCRRLDPIPWVKIWDLRNEIEAELKQTGHPHYELHLHVPESIQTPELRAAFHSDWNHGESVPLPQDWRGHSSYLPHTIIQPTLEDLLRKMNPPARALTGPRAEVIVELEEILYRNSTGTSLHPRRPSLFSVFQGKRSGDSPRAPVREFEVHLIFAGSDEVSHRSYQIDDQCVERIVIAAGCGTDCEKAIITSSNTVTYSSAFDDFEAMCQFVSRHEPVLRRRISFENLPLTLKVVAERVLFRDSLLEYESCRRLENAK